MTRRSPFGALSGAALCVTSACASTTAEREAEEVPTLAIEDYEFNLRRYIDRTVRVCGRVVRERSDWGVARIPPPGEFYFHGPPTVLVIACGDASPTLDADGCITGRVAARDGTLTPVPDRTGTSDDSPIDRDWFLHPQCPAASR